MLPARRSQATHGPWALVAYCGCGFHTTCSTRIACSQTAPHLVFIGPKILKPSRRQFGVFDGVLDVGSCTRILRVNPVPRKLGKMLPFTTCVRGLCYGI